MTARGYEGDAIAKDLTKRVLRLELKEARNRPASGITVTDGGGSYGGGFPSIQDIFDGIADGTIPLPFLRNTLGGIGLVEPLGTLGAAATVDLGNANYFWGTLDQDCDISTTGWTNLRDAEIFVEVIGDGTSTPTFLGVTWIGTAPGIVGLGDFLVVGLFSRDGGTVIKGVVVGGGGSGGTPATTVTDETTFGLTPAVGTDTEYARQDHTHGSPDADAVRDAGRWEHAVLTGSPPDDLYADGDWLYIWVP